MEWRAPSKNTNKYERSIAEATAEDTRSDA